MGFDANGGGRSVNVRHVGLTHILQKHNGTRETVPLNDSCKTSIELDEVKVVDVAPAAERVCLGGPKEAAARVICFSEIQTGQSDVRSPKKTGKKCAMMEGATSSYIRDLRIFIRAICEICRILQIFS